MAMNGSFGKLARNPVLNLIAYQCAWFACILSAAKGTPWIGSMVALLVVVWHVANARLPKSELALIAWSGVIGLSWESVIVQAGWIAYPSGNLISGIAPHWIVALWLVFATTFNVSLKWFKNHLSIVSLFGLIGGPVAYYAGSKFGALTLTPIKGLTAIAIGWAVLMPILMVIARHWDGINPLTEETINP